MDIKSYEYKVYALEDLIPLATGKDPFDDLKTKQRSRIGQLNKALDNLGQQGWKLIQSDKLDNSFDSPILIFIREKQS